MERDSVGEQVYGALRQDIIFGRLPPGQRLRLEALRKRYDASVTTLREILSRLTSEGFVTAEGQRGFEVTSVSAVDLREIAELRIMLESHALAKSFESGDLDWEVRVVAAHHKLQALEKRMAAGDESVREEWKRSDSEFHHRLIEGCGSRQLLQSHTNIFDKYLRYQMQTLTFRGEIAAREHRALLEAALARDAGSAVKILETHIRNGVKHAESAVLSV